jgi:hypothetical protein
MLAGGSWKFLHNHRAPKQSQTTLHVVVAKTEKQTSVAYLTL